MSHSINLDSSDIVGNLDDDFESIQAELDMLNAAHGDDETEKEIRSEDIELMGNICKEEMVIKCEDEEDVGEVIEQVDEIIIEKMEADEIMHDEESVDVNDMMHSVMELNTEDVHMQSDDEDEAIYSQRVIGEEEIIDDGQVMSDDSNASLHISDEQREEEFLEDMMNNVVTEETIIEPEEVEDHTKGELIIGDEMDELEPIQAEDSEPTTDTLSEAVKSITSGVYVVSSSSTNVIQQRPTFLQAGTILAPKDQKIGRVLKLPSSSVDGGTPQTIRIVAPPGKMLGPGAKAFTLAQARQMGLITPSTKLNHILPSATKVGMNILMIPSTPSKKTVTVMKSPTKILPAPPAPVSTNLTLTTQKAVPAPGASPLSSGPPQKMIIRQAGPLKPGTILTAAPAGTTAGSPQMIRIPTTQSGITHQIQLPQGSKTQQVQYLKLVSSGTGNKQQTLVPVSLPKSIPVPIALPTTLLNSTAFKVVPISSAPGTPSTQRVLIPASAASAQNLNSIVMLPSHLPQQVKKAKEPIGSSTPSSGTVTVMASSLSNSAQIKVSPSPEITSPTVVSSTVASSTSPTVISGTSNPPISLLTQVKLEPKSDSWSGDEGTFEANGIRPRKPCNCTKSMCLKLYCDCFANGEFCNQCNCICCYNNLEHEEERQRAIRSCLERNPTAFRPKIGKTLAGSEERRHNRGCNCKRSGCLKNYCECYEAKIPCSKNCKCFGCKNTTDGFTGKRLGGGGLLDDHDKSRLKSDASRALLELQKSGHRYSSVCRQAFNMMTPEVVKATCQCLIAQAESYSEDEKGQNLNQTHALIIEEFGRCVGQVIDCLTKSIPHSPVQSTS